MTEYDEMDAEADIAEQELSDMPDEEVAPIAHWFAKYFRKAGHKRLGRILVQASEELKKKGIELR